MYHPSPYTSPEQINKDLIIINHDLNNRIYKIELEVKFLTDLVQDLSRSIYAANYIFEQFDNIKKNDYE